MWSCVLTTRGGRGYSTQTPGCVRRLSAYIEAYGRYGLKDFRVQQIDHVELFVPDRYQAAKWYRDVLGLEILPDYELWAVKGGPLMISSDGGSTKLALFEGEAQGAHPPVGHHRVAFRVSGVGFVEFLDRLDTVTVHNHEDQQVNRRHVVDHGRAFSMYFCDPYGNRCEITTYDYDDVASKLG